MLKYDDIRSMMEAEGLNNWKILDMRKGLLGIEPDTNIDLEESLQKLDTRIEMLQTGYDKVYIMAAAKQKGAVQNWAGARKWKALINENLQQQGNHTANMQMAGNPMALMNQGWVHPNVMDMTMKLQKEMHDFQMDVIQDKMDNSDKTELDKYVPQRWQDILFCKAVGMEAADFAAIAKLSGPGPGTAQGSPRSTRTDAMTVVAAGDNEEDKKSGTTKPETAAAPVEAQLTAIEQTYPPEILKELENQLGAIRTNVAADKFLYLLKAFNANPSLADTAINLLTQK